MKLFNRISKTLRYLLAGFAALCLLLAILFYLSLPDVSFLVVSNPSTTAFIETYKNKTFAPETPSEIQWKWIPLSEISPYLLQAVIMTEDNTFWTHQGNDWDQLRRAMTMLWHSHRIVTGASTITQQVAKNLFLSSERSVVRKCKQILIAQQLEKHLSKERILEIYLNIAEWGEGIFGVEAASQSWFQCHASELTPKQSISLAFALPNPRKRDPTRLSPTLKMYVNMLLLKFAQQGFISDDEAIEALNLPDGYQDQEFD